MGGRVAVCDSWGSLFMVSLFAAGVQMTMGKLWMAPINWER